jgi:hypothetical protein
MSDIGRPSSSDRPEGKGKESQGGTAREAHHLWLYSQYKLPSMTREPLVRHRSLQDLPKLQSDGDRVRVPTKEEPKADDIDMIIIKNRNERFNHAEKAYKDWKSKLNQRNLAQRGHERAVLQARENGDPFPMEDGIRFIDASTQNLNAHKEYVEALRQAVGKYKEFLDKFVSDYYQLNAQEVQLDSQLPFSVNEGILPMIAKVLDTYAADGKSLEEGVPSQVLERFSKRYIELDMIMQDINAKEAKYIQEEQAHNVHLDHFNRGNQERQQAVQRRQQERDEARRRNHGLRPFFPTSLRF